MSGKLRPIMLLLLFMCNGGLSAQDSLMKDKQDLIGVFELTFPSFKPKPRDSDDFTLAIIPAPISEGGSGAVVTPIVSSFYLGDISTTKMSNVFFTPYFTFSNQFVFPLRAFMYTRNNGFNISSDIRFMIYPQKLFKLGGEYMINPSAILDYNQWRFHQLVTRKIMGHFFLGGGVQMDYYTGISEEPLTSDSSDYSKYQQPVYEEFFSSGWAIQFMYDSRLNNLNPDKGALFRTTMRFNTPYLASTDNWSSIFAEARTYMLLPSERRSVIAFWGVYWSRMSGTPHYLDLPSIGWDINGNTGRGIVKNRFRSNALVYFESEYRTEISRNGLWGAVLFLNVTGPSDFGTQRFNSWYGAGGTGIRVKWNKYTGVNFSVDLGFSRNYVGLYISLAENF